MIKGKVKFFHNAKGYGFAKPDDGGPDAFIPGTAIAAAGLKHLQIGQGILFETRPDPKGPKVVSLRILDRLTQSEDQAPPGKRITLYYHSSDKHSEEIMAALRSGRPDARLVDYGIAPLSQEELKRLSLSLAAAGQNLVRRHDSLFYELQLDDRFLGENDFWTAIIEHPVLINGPLLFDGANGRVCRTIADVRSFLRLSQGTAEQRRPKTISPRLAAMLSGQAVPPKSGVSDRLVQKVRPPKSSPAADQPKHGSKAKSSPANKPKGANSPPKQRRVAKPLKKAKSEKVVKLNSRSSKKAKRKNLAKRKGR